MRVEEDIKGFRIEGKMLTFMYNQMSFSLTMPIIYANYQIDMKIQKFDNALYY